MRKVKKTITLFIAIALIIVSTVGYGNIPVAASSQALVAYYSFDGNVNDQSGFNNNGIIAGNKGITFVPSVTGTGAKFDGKSYIEIKDSDSLDLTDGFTFSCWVYKDNEDDADQPIFQKGDTNVYDGHSPYAFLHSSDGFRPCVRVVDVDYDYKREFESDYKADIQKWQLITAAWDGTNITFYIDGVRMDSQTFEGTLAISDSKLVIGRDMMGNTTYFTGILDDLRIYNYPLDDQTISNLYSSGIANTQAVGFKNELVAQYKFEGDLKDSSNYANDGKTGKGAITFVSSIDGKGARFDGDSFIEVNDSDSLNIDKAFTFSAWVYREETNSSVSPIFQKGETNSYGNSSPYTLYFDDYNPVVRVVDLNYAYKEDKSSDEKVDIQKWQLVTATYDGTNIKFYIDGVPKDSISWKDKVVAHSKSKFIIGRDLLNKTSYFKGIIDDLRIYNYTLDDNQVKELFTPIANNKSVVGMQQKLVAQYNFDGDLKDSSGYNNDASGTLNYAIGIAGKGGRSDAVKFDGSSSISVEDSDSLDIDKQFTFTAWVNLDKDSSGDILPLFSKGNTDTYDRSNPYSFMVSSSYGKGYPGTTLVDLDYAYPQSNYSSNYIQVGKWSFIAVTYNGTNQTFYINGVRKDSLTWKGIVSHSEDKLIIGCRLVGGTKYFKGLMDEVKIYNYALKDSDISNLYKQKDILTVSPSLGSTIKARRSAIFKVYFTPLRGTKTDVTSKALYSTSNSSAVKITKGKYTGVTKGKTATVTIRYRNLSISKTIKVT